MLVSRRGAPPRCSTGLLTLRLRRRSVCGTKNSVRRVYGVSTSARELRTVCQRLNAARGERDEAMERAAIEGESYSDRGLDLAAEDGDAAGALEEEGAAQVSFWDSFRAGVSTDRATSESERKLDGSGVFERVAECPPRSPPAQVGPRPLTAPVQVVKFEALGQEGLYALFLSGPSASS